MAENNRDAENLKHILKYCDWIQHAKERFGSSYKIFSTDIEYQSACAMHILLIGEMAGRLSRGLKARYNDVPWREIIGMRNVFAHEYERIDVKKIWETLRDDIIPLREKCLDIIMELEPGYDQDDYDDDLLIDDEDEWEQE